MVTIRVARCPSILLRATLKRSAVTSGDMLHSKRGVIVDSNTRSISNHHHSQSPGRIFTGKQGYPPTPMSFLFPTRESKLEEV